ncbi:hypothetical protein [Sphingobacterium cavernae]|uniref:hypothetical protein n=1 Tax=Sphingobacterium cavernae TaxID=2592657 RepID=UPI00122FC1CD|nr:hypothetical protein [Sphingobacterium cavernae]
MFAKFGINPEVQNTKRRTVITAVLYMDKTFQKTQIEKLELEIIPLSFWEKIMQFYKTERKTHRCLACGM